MRPSASPKKTVALANAGDRFGLAVAIAEHRRRIQGAPLFVVPENDRIPMRHFGLARMLGGRARPGLPTGRFIEVLGREGAGKTTLTMAFADAVVNRPAGTHRVLCNDGKVREFPLPRKVAVLDFEQTFDVAYAKAAIRNAEFLDVDLATGELRNLDTANVLLHRPQLLEEGIDLGIALIESAEVGMLVVDSVPAMLPLEEREKLMGQSTMGVLARAMGKMFRKTVSIANRHGVVVVLVNQWRNKIGVAFGDPRSAPGGEAAKYFDSLRLDVSGANKDPWFPEGGKLCVVKALKNKVTGLRGEVTYHLGTGHGLSAEAELVDALVAVGVVKTPGANAKASVTLNGKKLVFPSRAALVESLRDPAHFAKLQSLAVERGAPFADAAVKEFGRDDD